MVNRSLQSCFRYLISTFRCYLTAKCKAGLNKSPHAASHQPLGCCRFMGGDFLGGRSKPARRRPACKTVFCVGVLPFSAGLLLIFVLFKSAPLGVHHRSLQETQHSPEPSTCPPSSTCNCSQNLTGSDDLRHLEGALTKTSLDKVLGAANSSDPQEQTVRINEDVLPSTFLFVGVLSGRGYRCAVRNLL